MKRRVVIACDVVTEYARRARLLRQEARRCSHTAGMENTARFYGECASRMERAVARFSCFPKPKLTALVGKKGKRMNTKGVKGGRGSREADAIQG